MDTTEISPSFSIALTTVGVIKNKTNKKEKYPFVSVCTPTFNRRPFIPIMLKCFEHQTHHRGQTTVYIRLAGGTPPAEKLF